MFKKIKRQFNYLIDRMKKYFEKFGVAYGLKVAIAKGLYVIFGRIPIAIFKKVIRKSSENRIIIESRPDFADNGYALHHYLIENGYNRSYKIVWLVEEPKLYKKYKCRNVKFINKMGKLHRHRTVLAFYYTLRSKYVFFTHALRWAEKKTLNQIYINLWHGCGYKATRASDDVNVFDYCLVPGKVFVETKSKFFDCPKKKILTLGYPRYQFFKSSSVKADQYLKGLPGKKNILWMPTFRDSDTLIYYDNPIPAIIGLPLLNSILDFRRLNELCKEADINLIIKWHRNAGVFGGESEKAANIFFLDDNKLKEFDMVLYELISRTDALITDFSSVAIDYLILDKPLGFTMDDFEDYKRTRGFIFEDPKKYMPGHHIFNLDDLKEFFAQVASDQDPYAENRYAIMDETHNQTDDYCKRILDYFGICLK